MRSIGIVGTYPAEALGTADVVVARLDMLTIDVDHRLRTVSISTNHLEVS
jgi:hypothetical protein